MKTIPTEEIDALVARFDEGNAMRRSRDRWRGLAIGLMVGHLIVAIVNWCVN